MRWILLLSGGLMKNRYTVQNLYKTTLSANMAAISPSGDPLTEYTFTLTVPPTNTSGWLIIDFTDSSKRDLIYYHNVVGSTVTYYRKNRDLLGTGAISIQHDQGAFVQINDFAQLFNYLFDNVDDFGFVEDAGTNKVFVKWGKLFTGSWYVTVSDYTSSAISNGTNYIIFNYATNDFQVVTSFSGLVYMLLATVTVSAWEVTSIVDERAVTRPLQFDPDMFTIAADWLVKLIGGNSISDATTSSKGRVQLATIVQLLAWTAGPYAVTPDLTKSTSAGAGDAGYIPRLNASGKLDASFYANVPISAIAATGTPWSGNYLRGDGTRSAVNEAWFILGNGSDGDLVVTSGTTSLVAWTIYNYNTVNIAVWATLNTAGNGTLILKCKWLCNIAGTIDQRGKAGSNLSWYLFSKLSANVWAMGSGGNGGAGGVGASWGTVGTWGTAASGYGGGWGWGTNAVGAAKNGGNGGWWWTPWWTGGAGGTAWNNGAAWWLSAGWWGAGGNSDVWWAGANAYSAAGSNAAWISSGAWWGSGGIPGTNAGCVVIYAYQFSGSWTINCSGTAWGNGWAWGQAQSVSGGRGWGGGWGAWWWGGAVICVGYINVFGGTITVAGGAGGTWWAVAGTGIGGVAGADGVAGTNGNYQNVLFNSYTY